MSIASNSTVIILGSTGSIGTQGLDVISRHPERFTVTGLAAGGAHIELLAQQAAQFHVSEAAVFDETKVPALQAALAQAGAQGVRVTGGPDSVIAMAGSGANVVLNGITGSIGLEPSIAALKAGSQLALANKESVVAGGHLLFSAQVRENQINPVDSEHSAIWQSLRSGTHAEVAKLVVTASGGPFRGRSRQELAGMRAEDALKHPNWSMGRKITVDSASLVNKALEVMEARWLFDVELDSIQVVIHPQSIIHSMVEYVDGAVIAQLGMPDMKLPIQYALFYPERRPMAGERVDFFKLGQITFERPDTEVFTGLKLGMQAARTGGSMPTVFNAANEKAVAMFLNHSIGFLEIPELIEKCMNHHRVIENPNVNEILQAEAETYEYIEHIKEN